MLFIVGIFLVIPSLLFSQEPTASVYPVPCYYNNKLIPGRSLILGSENIQDNQGSDTLRLIASLPPEGGYNRLLMADCNHNGRMDFIYRGSGAFIYFIENQGNNAFIISDTLSGHYYIPLAVGDLDNDGLTDLVVQEGNFLRVLESSSPSAFPRNVVWSYSLDGQYGEGRFEQYAVITDLDNDGRKEILVTSNTFPLNSGYGYISIFENSSNNNYSRIFYYGFNYPYSIAGYIAADDFDNNGKMEFACTAGLRDTLYVFENVLGNNFRLKFSTFTGLTNQYPVISGNDLDNDGKKEIIVSGDNSGQPGYRNILVYEASSGDNFTLNTNIVQYTGLVGFQPVSTGNIFNSGRDELIFESHRIYIYNSAGNNNFSLRDSSLYYSNATNVYCYDVNPGGLSELEVLKNSGLLLFDNPGLTGLTNENREAEKFTLHQNYPNPFNPSTKIRFEIPAGSKDVVRLIVFDITGKEITTLINSSLSQGIHETEWNASDYPAGIYFYTLATAGFSDTRKMILLK